MRLHGFGPLSQVFKHCCKPMITQGRCFSKNPRIEAAWQEIDNLEKVIPTAIPTIEYTNARMNLVRLKIELIKAEAESENAEAQSRIAQELKNIREIYLFRL